MLLGAKCRGVKAERRSLFFHLALSLFLKQLFYLKWISLGALNSLRGLFGQAERSRHFAKIRATFHSLLYASRWAPVAIAALGVEVILNE